MADDDVFTGWTKPSQEELDATVNRIQLELARREALVRKMMANTTATDLPPRKTDAELDAEDALLFRPQPPYLGLGCPIPENYLISEADRSKKNLEAKFGKGLQASKRRDAEEKAESAKRALNEDSSDEEGGRSSLGKKKKLKIEPAKVETPRKVSAQETVKKFKKTKVDVEPKDAKKVNMDDTKDVKVDKEKKANKVIEVSTTANVSHPILVL